MLFWNTALMLLQINQEHCWLLIMFIVEGFFDQFWTFHLSDVGKLILGNAPCMRGISLEVHLWIAEKFLKSD